MPAARSAALLVSLRLKTTSDACLKASRRWDHARPETRSSTPASPAVAASLTEWGIQEGLTNEPVTNGTPHAAERPTASRDPPRFGRSWSPGHDHSVKPSRPGVTHDRVDHHAGPIASQSPDPKARIARSVVPTRNGGQERQTGQS